MEECIIGWENFILHLAIWFPWVKNMTISSICDYDNLIKFDILPLPSIRNSEPDFRTTTTVGTLFRNSCSLL